MPYISPPPFTPGAILTAAQLNILSDDIEYINSVTDYINVPFSTYTYGLLGIQNMEDASWVIRHRHRYLHYYLVLDSGTITNTPHVLHLDINWGAGWRTGYSAGGVVGSPPNTVAGYVDLEGNDVSGTPITVADGDFMQIRWSANCDGLATAYYFAESSFTTL